MANSKYEYVRSFEQPDGLLANTWIIVRIDGRGFSKLTAKYKFVKPNDRNASDLMNAAAVAVMTELPDLVLAYGNSDEYSFIFHKDCVLFERRASKLTTTIVSTFSSYYVFLWPKYFPDKPLTPPLPSFDGRAVCYPSDLNLRDYLSWRQADCHINNLYNTTFWALVQQGGMGRREAEQKLSGTVSSDKNEILFKEFGINYNNEPDCFKKGTVLYRDFFPSEPEPKEPPADKQAHTSLPIAAPRPRRVTSRPASQPIERAVSQFQDPVRSPADEGPGPTFLSTTSTPSPPPSPPNMLRSQYPNPLRSNPVSPRTSIIPPAFSNPLSPSTTAPSPYGSPMSPQGKQGLPPLIPLPLSPLTLKPSTKPPLSLNPPNPTTRTNFSPTSPPQDFPADYPIAGYSHRTTTTVHRPASHSTSPSMDIAGPSYIRPTGLKQRSPSQPHLPTYFSSSSYPPGGPPVIPLRISSIPLNNKTRKLSLRNQQSASTLKNRRYSFEEKENVIFPIPPAGQITPRKISPPLRTNKALPSPPMNLEEEMRTREKVMGSTPHQDWSRYAVPGTKEPSIRRISDPDKRVGQIWTDNNVLQPAIAELPATESSSARRVRSYSGLRPQPSSLKSPYQGPDIDALSSAASSSPPKLQPQSYPTDYMNATDFPIQPTPPLKDSPRSRAARSSLTPPSRTSPPARPPRTSLTPPTSKPEAAAARAKETKHRGTQSVVEPPSKAEQGGWAVFTQPQTGNEGRPLPMSRTQKDKDRKKRSRAKVLIEHVDIIKDEFWEKRPWILSGKTG